MTSLPSDTVAADTATRPTSAPAWPFRVLLPRLRNLDKGQLDVVLPDGEVHRFVGREPGPHGAWHLRHPRLLARLAARGEVGLGEAYMAREWDSPDLCSLLQVLFANEQRLSRAPDGNRLVRMVGEWQHRWRANTRGGSRRNIEHHYDLGNDFYAHWLDPTWAYSSAVFESAEQSLEDAQRNKFEGMCRRLELAPHHHLLEIGCGWGGFAIHAAQRHGCRVTGITLSGEQLRFARERAREAGVADRVEFQLRDYRDLSGTFDRVVSIEMYEAVGERFWPAYFRAISEALAQGGVAAIQGITIAESSFEHYRRKRDFIQKHIFPGGMLSPAGRLFEEARRQGLEPGDAAFFGDHYARTLQQWHRSVLASRREIELRFGGRFLRMWTYYLAYCECGFRSGNVDLLQLTLRKP